MIRPLARANAASPRRPGKRIFSGSFATMIATAILIGLLRTASSFQSAVRRPLSLHPNRALKTQQQPHLGSSPWSSTSAHRRTPHTHLFSLQPLVDQVVAASTSQSGSKKPSPSTIFVGGKGGVGKTTVSAALSVLLASASEGTSNPLRVLVVSTDPAHSLGDALDEDLKRGQGRPVPWMGSSAAAGVLPSDATVIDACEIDPSAALQELQTTLQTFDVNRLADALGVSAEVLEGLGLREFSQLLDTPPPGLDELVALANVIGGDHNNNENDYDVIVVDTAPTGHTLRLLELPQFLDGLLGKLIRIRQQLSGLASTFQSFFGTNPEQRQREEQRAQTIANAVDSLDAFRAKLKVLQERLKDESQTSFVVVTVPTKLGVAESTRLMAELNSQGVRVSDVVVNQCVGGLSTEDDEGSSEALQTYYSRRQASQARWISMLEETARSVSQSPEYKDNGDDASIQVTSVPFFDVELVGAPALAYLGQQCFRENPAMAHLMDGSSGNTDFPRVVICGGKGGVGKTTTSSSLAVTMATQGRNVALISTDPAHSVGDAFDMSFAGGKLTEVPMVGVPSVESSGSLSVMEIDPAAALGQFKGVIDQLVGGGSGGDEDSGLTRTLRDLQDIFSTLPAGTDEVVALAKIVNLVKKGDYDRIVLDTAPTGHTLRMLSTPGFIAELIDRVLLISDKINSNSAVKLLIGSSGRSEDIATAVSTAKSTLLSFQLQMYDLEDLFADADQTEFLIVTVPTELAVRESTRLLNDLTFGSPDMPIKCRNIVANQVLGDDNAQSFLGHLEKTQAGSILTLEQSIASSSSSSSSSQLEITKVGYLDTEPRGIYGLKALADELVK